MNLAETLVATAAAHADRTALKLDEIELPYAAYDHATARVAGLLRERGLEPGDRVALMLPNLPYFPILYYGVLRAGGIVVPMNVLLKRREVRHQLADTGARLVFAWHGMAAAAEAAAQDTGTACVLVRPGEFEALLGAAPVVEEVAERDDEDTGAVIYTSGTTGRPRGAELTHRNLRRNAEVSLGVFDLGADAVILGTLPFFHAFGQTCAMNVAVVAGGCVTMLPRFDPQRALEIIERDRVSVFEGVPTMYSALLGLPEPERFDVGSLRLFVSGGSALPVRVLHEVEEAFRCPVHEGYGLTETAPVASFNHPGQVRKPGTIGTPIEGCEMRIVDEDDRELAPGQVGEIAIRGEHVMKGYWHAPEATAEVMRGGWLHTGDLGHVDEDGYFTIVDRKKDMIIRGGYNVYPREVEDVLYEHPAVREAAVIGVPDAHLGEDVAALVALREGAHATPAELRAYLKREVAAYKYPRQVVIVDDLPLGPTGKVLKRELTLPASGG
jgi:long-chain acyl-CoA synthetase